MEDSRTSPYSAVIWTGSLDTQSAYSLTPFRKLQCIQSLINVYECKNSCGPFSPFVMESYAAKHTEHGIYIHQISSLPVSDLSHRCKQPFEIVRAINSCSPDSQREREKIRKASHMKAKKLRSK